MDTCECLGYENLPTSYFEENGYDDDYGSSCENWDADQPWCLEEDSEQDA